ncbi:MAG: hypothetical protein C5B49_05590, partial [Bdellovibrio sp.]
MISKQRSEELGLLLVTIFVFAGAFQEVYLGNIVQRRDPVLVMFCTFLIAFLFFNGVGNRTVFSKVRKSASLWKDVLLMNFTTALSWFGFVLALQELEPAIVSVICFSLGPVLTALLNSTFRPGRILLRVEVLSSLGMTFSVLFLVATAVMGTTGVGKINSIQAFLGIAWAVSSAFGIMGNTFYSKRLSAKGMSASETMAVRFPLLLVLGVATLIKSKTAVPLDGHFFLEVLLLSVSTVIIPLYLLQLGIESIEPITVSLVMSLTPVVTYFLQLFDSRLMPSITSLIG